MALSAGQKQKIIELLAEGRTASQAADIIGCSRASVQRVKKNPKFASLVQIASGLAATKKLDEQADELLATINTFREREPQVQQALWSMFEGLSGLFEQVLRKTSPDDVGSRQLPALAKSAADIANAYANYVDRVNGLDVLADEIQKINESRAASLS